MLPETGAEPLGLTSERSSAESGAGCVCGADVDAGAVTAASLEPASASAKGANSPHTASTARATTKVAERKKRECFILASCRKSWGGVWPSRDTSLAGWVSPVKSLIAQMPAMRALQRYPTRWR